MKLSVVIPAHNEEKNIPETVESLHARLSEEGIEHEILVVNDHSTDATGRVIDAMMDSIPTLRRIDNPLSSGFGYAVRAGLDRFSGGCVAIFMADLSDRPEDLVRFYRTLVDGGYDAVFGSRFMPGGKVEDYPEVKLFINRMANLFIRVLFGLKYNDVTNAFKIYRRETIEGLRPLLAPHFNLTVELPLKTIVRGYSYTWLPNHWRNRRQGRSKLKIKEMGSRYLFIVLYCLIEKYLTRGDYGKKAREEKPGGEPALINPKG